MLHSLDLWRDFDRNFNDAFRVMRPWLQEWDEHKNGESRRENRRFVAPACDVEEHADHFFVTVDLPGVNKEDIKIDVADGQLSITADRRSEERSKKGQSHLVERHYGQFLRTFSLPKGIDAEKIEAQYKDGVLKVALAKAQTAQSRRIPVGENKNGILKSLFGEKDKTTKEGAPA